MAKVKHPELRSIDDLTAAPYNPRTISTEAAGGLSESIKRFGDIGGIVWNQRTGNLVCGHQRVDQLRRIGGQLVGDRIVVEANGSRREFPVRIVDWPDAEEKAANVAANNPEIAGAFSDGVGDLLREICGSIGSEDFEALRLNALLDSVPEPEKEIVQDEIPEPPKEPVTKPGDVWTLGDHRLICGDISEQAARLLEGETFDLLVTDPPYGVSYASKNEFLNNLDKGNRIQTEIANDHHPPEEMRELWERWFASVRPFARPGASYYVTGPQGGDLLLLLLLLEALRAAGYPLRHMLVWAKNNHVLGRCDYHYKHEPILYGWVDGAHRFHGGTGETSLWEIDRPSQSKLHPTMKPVELFAKAIANSTLTSERVLDPFLGSGTTLIASEQLGRVCRGTEISPAYCDVIVERWENLTGGKATRASA